MVVKRWVKEAAVWIGIIVAVGVEYRYAVDRWYPEAASWIFRYFGLLEIDGRVIEMRREDNLLDPFFRVTVEVKEADLKAVEWQMLRWRGRIELPVPGIGCQDCYEEYKFEEAIKWIVERELPKYRYRYGGCWMVQFDPWMVEIDRTRKVVTVERFL